jgi:hypothetical protein
VLMMILGPLARRAEQQRQAATFEISQLILDALPDDARKRVFAGMRERQHTLARVILVRQDGRRRLI